MLEDSVFSIQYSGAHPDVLEVAEESETDDTITEVSHLTTFRFRFLTCNLQPGTFRRNTEIGGLHA